MALFGVKGKLKIAPPESDGSMPAQAKFVDLCRTYRDSFEYNDGEINFDDEFSDQDDEPIETFEDSEPGEGKFSAFEFENAILGSLFPNATVLNDEFKSGKGKGFKTALQLTTDSGHTIAWPVVRLTSKLNLKLQKKGLALVDCKFRPLSKISIKKTV